jgi:predicted transcriptional regulator
LRISRTKTDWWEELTLSQQKEILAGLKDAETGKVMDSSKFWENLKNG